MKAIVQPNGLYRVILENGEVKEDQTLQEAGCLADKEAAEKHKNNESDERIQRI